MAAEMSAEANLPTDAASDSFWKGVQALMEAYCEAEEDLTMPENDRYTGASSPGQLYDKVQQGIAEPPDMFRYSSGYREEKLQEAFAWKLSRYITEVNEPDASKTQAASSLFSGWDVLQEYNLDGCIDVVSRLTEQRRKDWNQVKANLTVLGNGGGAEGLLGNLLTIFQRPDWLALYRAQPRVVRALPNLDISQVLEMEKNAFSCTRFYGSHDHLTVTTHGERQTGTVSLFSVALERAEAQLVKQLAVFENVPKKIIKNLKGPAVVDLSSRDGNIEKCLHDSCPPELAVVDTISHCGGTMVANTRWRSGHFWRQALGVAVDFAKDDEALVASLPQMLALLHLNGYNLHGMKAQVHKLKSPLSPAASVNARVLQRVALITEAPQYSGHQGRRVRVRVLFPEDSAWAKEALLWG